MIGCPGILTLSQLWLSEVMIPSHDMKHDTRVCDAGLRGAASGRLSSAQLPPSLPATPSPRPAVTRTAGISSFRATRRPSRGHVIEPLWLELTPPFVT